ncbi:MAG: hypothetical protein J5I52_10235 [Saprospiraceae bacterium]|nr:hypothetical protein [Saprospiraceae bacterium]
MLKLFSIFTTVVIISIFIFGCGDDAANRNGEIAPPSWIIGSWEDETEYYGVVFTTNNVRFLTFGNVSLDINSMVSNSLMNVVESEKTNDVYEIITSDIAGITSQKYRFEKGSADEIDYYSGSLGPSILYRK